ncbi:protein IRX15-LIKE-like [Zea mays]|uniref:protein IRX15-LIKE-like n=1 Tax=Zea mays TaxID=4577 RepID=UPI0004DE9F1F|nr:protein IRX15-LIKE-like [Zea mays]|eukprot:XP_008666418.1 protein IRX15-LIKE-like [Zea mays]
MTDVGPSIFTAAVLARSGATAAKGPTDVLVHDFQFEVEQVLSRDFLCDENRVAGSGTPSLGHFVIRGGGAGAGDAFCSAQEDGSSGEKTRRRRSRK